MIDNINDNAKQKRERFKAAVSRRNRLKQRKKPKQEKESGNFVLCRL